MAHLNALDLEDDDSKDAGRGGASARFKDFDCPSCNANNPTDFGHDDEVLCNYCGTEFKVKVTDDGKAKFREI